MSRRIVDSLITLTKRNKYNYSIYLLFVYLFIIEKYNGNKMSCDQFKIGLLEYMDYSKSLQP